VNYTESASDTSSIKSSQTPRSPSKESTKVTPAKSSSILALKITAVIKKKEQESPSPARSSSLAQSLGKKNDVVGSGRKTSSSQIKAKVVSPVSGVGKT